MGAQRKGMVDFARRKSEWNKFERKGFVVAGGAQGVPGDGGVVLGTSGAKGVPGAGSAESANVGKL